MFNQSFGEIRITEYLENNYVLEIKKNPLFSIGKIFGILEELVNNISNILYTYLLIIKFIRNLNVMLTNTQFRKLL